MSGKKNVNEDLEAGIKEVSKFIFNLIEIKSFEEKIAFELGSKLARAAKTIDAIEDEEERRRKNLEIEELKTQYQEAYDKLKDLKLDRESTIRALVDKLDIPSDDKQRMFIELVAIKNNTTLEKISTVVSTYFAHSSSSELKAIKPHSFISSNVLSALSSVNKKLGGIVTGLRDIIYRIEILIADIESLLSSEDFVIASSGEPLAEENLDSLVDDLIIELPGQDDISLVLQKEEVLSSGLDKKEEGEGLFDEEGEEEMLESNPSPQYDDSKRNIK